MATTTMSEPEGAKLSILADIESMEAFLQTLTMPEHLHTQDWMKQVRDLSYVIEDTIDEFTRLVDDDPTVSAGGSRNKLDADCSFSYVVAVTALYAEVSRLVGMYEVSQWLVGKENGQSLRGEVLFIFGIGELGKIVFAMAVYRHHEGQLVCHAFVSVSSEIKSKYFVEDTLLLGRRV